MDISVSVAWYAQGSGLSPISIPVRGRIKETARVDNLVIHPDDGWITSYPPVVNGYVIQMLNTKL